MKLFFVTDIHGSNVCYRKFLNALRVYSVDVAILLGDLTGKLLIPLVEEPAGHWSTTFMGHDVQIETQAELDKLKKTIEMVGYYWCQVSLDEFRALKADPARLDALFNQLMMERLEEWLAMADERLAGAPYRVYMAPGNDDHFEIDPVIAASAAIISANDRVLSLGEYEMATFAWTNPTPWDTPREKPDQELDPMLEALIAQVKDKRNAIFNFHAPPFGSALDLAPELSANLVQAADRKVHVGSQAVARAIQKHQPLLGLHGHIHESRGIQKIGRTTIVNPGSEYSEGILKGVLLVLDKGKLKDYIFTSG